MTGGSGYVRLLSIGKPYNRNRNRHRARAVSILQVLPGSHKAEFMRPPAMFGEYGLAARQVIAPIVETLALLDVGPEIS